MTEQVCPNRSSHEKNIAADTLIAHPSTESSKTPLESICKKRRQPLRVASPDKKETHDHERAHSEQ